MNLRRNSGDFKTRSLVSLFCAACVALSTVEGSPNQPQKLSEPEPRSWKDKSGKFSVEATLRHVGHDMVRLERSKDSKIIEVERKRLSSKDREYIRFVSDDQILVETKPHLIKFNYEEDLRLPDAIKLTKARGVPLMNGKIEPKKNHSFLLIEVKLLRTPGVTFESGPSAMSVFKALRKIYDGEGHEFPLFGVEIKLDIGTALAKPPNRRQRRPVMSLFGSDDPTPKFTLVYQVPANSGRSTYRFTPPQKY